MELSKIVYEDEYIRMLGDRHVEISKITTNFTSYGNGVLLIILSGDISTQNRDLLSRFSAIICNTESFAALSDDAPCTLICVKSPRRAWALAESRIRRIDYSKIRIIAITGTNGKTTTAMLVKRMLEQDGKRVGFIGTGLISIGGSPLSEDFYSMTTPDPPLLYEAIKLMSEQNVTDIVMEVSSHALYYEKIAAIRFSLSVFTNLSREHLDFHSSVEEYAETKLKLSAYSSTLLFGVDDPIFRSAYYKCHEKKFSYGIIWDADFCVSDLHDLGFNGAKFICRARNFSFSVVSKMIGKFNIYNALAALSAAIILGVAPCVAKLALSDFNGVEGRVETVYNSDIRVIIDYAHNEAAFGTLLKTISDYSDGEITVIFGCGGERYAGKRSKMARIAEKYASRIYVTSDNQRNEPQEIIFADITSGFSESCNYCIIADRGEAIRRAILDAKTGDTLLLVGKGRERYNIDSTGYHPFDERDIVRRATEEREQNYESKT